MRRSLVAATAALSLAVGMSTTAEAKTYCQKAATGYKVSEVVVAQKRCLAILVTSPEGLPKIVFKDLAEGGNSSAVNTVAYGAQSASVASMSMSTNCAVAWGESSSDGTTTS